MPKQKVNCFTRKKSSEMFGGCLNILSFTEPSTHWQLIQYFYHLQITSNGAIDDWCIAHPILNEVKQIWQSVNPRLP